DVAEQVGRNRRKVNQQPRAIGELSGEHGRSHRDWKRRQSHRRVTVHTDEDDVVSEAGQRARHLVESDIVLGSEGDVGDLHRCTSGTANASIAAPRRKASMTTATTSPTTTA